MSRFDRWSTDGVRSGLERELALRNIGRVMVDVIGDAYRGISTSASMIPDKQRNAEASRPPSGGAVPLTTPHVEACDRVAASFAQEDRISLIRKKLEDAEIERRLAAHNPHKAKTEYNHLQRFDKEQASLHRDDHD